MPASMFVIIWGFVGFYMVLFVAAIKGIPSEFYDAARLDGAGRLRIAWSITVPLIRDTVQTAYIYLGILALDAFVYMAALNPGGGPDNSTLVMPQRLLDAAFAKGQFGLASAMGVVMAIATLAFAAIVFALNRLIGGQDSLDETMTTTIKDAPATPTTPVRERLPVGERVVAAISHVVLGFWSLLVIVPLLWTLMSSFKTSSEIFASPFGLPSHWNFDNYVSAWTTQGIGRYFLNTVIVVGCALVIVMILGAMCAYVLACFSFPGRRFIYYSMLAGLTFPIFMAIVPLFFVLKNIGLLNTLPGLIITYVAFALPFTVFFLYPFFRALPTEISDAADIDGAGEWRKFFSVMLPMARNGMASVAIFNFLGLWNQFLLPVALNTKRQNYVLSQGMASFASQAGYNVDYGRLFAAVVITVVPVLVVYTIFQRQLQGSVTQGTSK